MVDLVTADAAGLFAGSPTNAWGIYRGGVPVVVADNVTAFEIRKQWAISSYPVERGSFESFDKVEVPFGVRFRFTAGGSSAKRQALLESIIAIAGDLNLYDVVTPDRVYLSANIERYDYSQTATNGVGLLQVDVTAIEIREVGEALLSATQSPTDAAQTNDGPAQPTPATPAQSGSLGFGPGGLPIGGF